MVRTSGPASFRAHHVVFSNNTPGGPDTALLTVYMTIPLRILRLSNVTQGSYQPAPQCRSGWDLSTNYIINTRTALVGSPHCALLKDRDLTRGERWL